MAREKGEVRTVGVGGAEYRFERGESAAAGRKVGERKLVAVWVSSLPGDEQGFTTATVNEFDDGILYGPSSVPGLFSDFAGAAAAEVTVRWLEMSNRRLVARTKRQRDIMMTAAGVLAVIVVVMLSFR